MSKRCWVIIPSAGIGTRMHADSPKQYLPLAGRMVLEHSLSIFSGLSDVQKVVVVIHPDDHLFQHIDLSDYHDKVMKTTGGSERCLSVLKGLQALENLADDEDWVLVHDAARPCVTEEDIRLLIDTLNDSDVGGLLAIPVKDTLKRADDANSITETVDRSQLWHALTPQMFRYGQLKQAIEHAIEHDHQITDDASAIELLGLQPMIVEGSPTNIKLTYPKDLLFAEKLLGK